MFNSIASLEADLLSFARNRSSVGPAFRFSESDVGRSLIQLAAGKLPKVMAEAAAADALPSGAMRDAARRFVSEVMLGPNADHYTALGLPPDADAQLLRDNFRRLMALVHPDAQPEGFPTDAASRVNRAYAVLADPAARESYSALQNLVTPVVYPTMQTVPRRSAARTQAPPPGGLGDRLRGLAQALRARQILLWLAVLLLVPLGFGLMSLVSHEPPPRLVEARPKLSFSVDLGATATGPTASQSDNQLASLSPVVREQAAPAAATAETNVRTASATSKAPLRLPVEPVATPLPRSAMTAQLSSRSLDAARMATPPPALAPVASVGGSPAASVAAASNSTAAAAANGVSSDSSGPALRQNDVAPSAPPPPAGTTVAVAQQRPPAGDRPDASRMRTADAEDVLVRFTNAYEMGSITSFSQLFASNMAGRRQLLSDYERVFQATRQRSIKFNQLKHASAGDRVSTSGYATVTTTDQDSRVVTQRVFLEFEIGRERGEPRIERLANYVIH